MIFIIECTMVIKKIIMDKILVTVTMTPNSVVGVHGGSREVVGRDLERSCGAR